MVFSAPSVAARTRPDTAATPFPAATRTAAPTVASTNRTGTAAATSDDTAAASAPADGATPRRARLARNRSRARDSRDRTVPRGQPRVRAASSAVFPSR